MKIAMTIWGNRVSPVFDSAQTILIAEIENRVLRSQSREFIPGKIPATLARLLVEKKIDTLICGAISKQPAHIIESAGIRLVSFVTGNAEKLMQAYASGAAIEDFRMPGCGIGRRAKRRNGRTDQDGSSTGPDMVGKNHPKGQEKLRRYGYGEKQ